MTPGSGPREAQLPLDGRSRRDIPGPWLRIAARRVRERPWLLVPASAVAAALGVSVATRGSVSPHAELAAFALWAWATITALIAAAALNRRFHVTPGEPGDDASPIRARWTWGNVASGFGPADVDVHVLPGTLRLAAREWLGRDVAGIVAGAALGAFAAGCAGCAAIPALAWALGFPRIRRVGLDVPWDDVPRVVGSPAGRFLFWRGMGDRVSIELQAKFSHRERLVEALRDHVGDRFGVRGDAVPALLVGADDADDSLGDVLLRRVRARPGLGIAAVVWAGAFACGVAAIAGIDELAAVAGVLSFVSVLLAAFARSSASYAMWVRVPRAADDSQFPFSLRWTNRRGWPGPRGAEAHVLPHGLRVVACEWETWDALVVAAWMLLGVPAGAGFGVCAGTCFGVLTVHVLAKSFGLPRRRRVAVDLFWQDVSRVEIRGFRIEIRTRLPEPADRVVLDARYAHRDGLTRELSERLGERVFVAQRIPPGKDVPAREPTAEDLAAQTERLRKLGRAEGDSDAP